MGHISNPIVNRLGFSSFWSSFWSSFLEKNYSYFLSEDFALEDFIFWFFFSKKNSVLKKEHYLISKFSIYRTFSRFIIKINYIPLLEDNSIIFMFFSLLRVRFSFLSTFRKVSLTSEIGSSVIKSKSNDNIFVFLLNMWLPKKNFSNWCFIYCGITQDSKLLANRYKNWKNNSFLQKKIKLDLSLLKLKKKFRIFYKKLSSIKVFFFEKLSFRCKFFFLKTLYLLDKLDLKLDLRSLKNAVELLNLIIRLVFFYKSLKFQINLFLDRRKFFINRFRNNIRVPLIEYWLSDIDHRRHFLRLHKSLNVISADELKLSKKFKFLLSDDLDSRNNFTSLEGNSFCYSSFLKLKLLRLHFLVFFIRFFNLKKKIDKKTFYLFSVYFFLNLKLSESNAPFGLKKKKEIKASIFF